jgi:FkbM family methyltransferase
MYWLRLPKSLWSLLIIYYIKRLLGIRSTIIESNWVYFLRIALQKGVTIKQKENSFHVSNPQTGQTAVVRPASSDILVYIQIFFHHEYNKISALALPPLPTIMDLGANVGFFLLYCKDKWPDAVVSCIEPDLQNYNQLAKQIRTNNLKTITTFHGGIWMANEPLSITRFADDMEWGIGVKSDALGRVNGLTLRQIMNDSGLKKIDLLKMDIEGTEEQLFQNEDFLSIVSSLIMETHSATGQQKISTQLTKIGFIVESDRELLFATNAATL